MEEGLGKPEPEQRQEIVVSKGKNEVDHNEQKLETCLKSIQEPCSSNDKGPIYEERRLRVKELGGDTAYESIEKCLPNTSFDKLPHPCDMVPPCPDAMVETEKLTQACDTPVPTLRAQDVKITRACAYTHGRGRSERSRTRPCDTAVYQHAQRPWAYKELQSPPSLRNLKLHSKRFSTTAMSYPTTTITSSLDTVVVEPNLYHHQSILLQSHYCLG
ncbi:hypothetical protein GOBAR_AA04268 [Gossypium barbadense]|uniref:Uncharacterized protein n=1 Tax=Gossypium barbadense TaxID=3634 RepID=A0A2P5YL58_GOSBA|nr:hypothetical protein GOBAR_AA04268 [Gossypium barbadense]